MGQIQPISRERAGLGGIDVAAAFAMARSGSATDRQALLLSLAEVCRTQEACAIPEVQLILRDIFLNLITDAENTIRARLAATLAETPWAPEALIQMLARQDISIARPILSRSPVLDDCELIKLLVECSIEHQVEIARRPTLSANVASAIVAKAEPQVVVALAQNGTADLTQEDLARLVRLSISINALHEPLSHHVGLTSELAAVLVGWVGETLRRTLTDRFPESEGSLQEAVKSAVSDMRTALDVPGFSQEESSERMASERRQVKRLELSGQLRPGFLIRALNEGRLSLFTTAMSALAGVSTDDLRSAMTADQTLPFQVICTLAGLDKSAFPTVLGLVQSLNGGLPADHEPSFEPSKPAQPVRARVWT